MIWKQKVSIEILNSRNAKTLSEYLCIQFIELGDDYVIATMPIHSNILQPMGIVHGGSSCALAETTASSAANYCIDNGRQCVGLCLNINYIRPTNSGVLTAKAIPTHLGKKTQIWEVTLINEQKKITSTARITLAVIDKI